MAEHEDHPQQHLIKDSGPEQSLDQTVWIRLNAEKLDLMNVEV